LTSFNTKNIEKIAQLNPAGGPENNQSGRPFFSFTFDTLPVSYNVNINLVLYALVRSKKYSLQIDMFDNNDNHMLNDIIHIDTTTMEVSPDQMLTASLIASGFNIKMKPISIPDSENNTYRIEVKLFGDDGTFKDSSKTYFFVKKEK
jgi:hypothetical protein